MRGLHGLRAQQRLPQPSPLTVRHAELHFVPRFLKRIIAVPHMLHHHHGRGGIFASYGSDFYLDIVQGRVSPKDNPFIQDSPGRKLKLGMGDLNPWPLLRIALSWASWVPDPSDPSGKGRIPAMHPPHPMSYLNLAKQVDALFGDPPGTRKVERR